MNVLAADQVQAVQGLALADEGKPSAGVLRRGGQWDFGQGQGGDELLPRDVIDRAASLGVDDGDAVRLRVVSRAQAVPQPGGETEELRPGRVGEDAPAPRAVNEDQAAVVRLQEQAADRLRAGDDLDVLPRAQRIDADVVVGAVRGEVFPLVVRQRGSEAQLARADAQRLGFGTIQIPDEHLTVREHRGKLPAAERERQHAARSLTELPRGREDVFPFHRGGLFVKVGEEGAVFRVFGDESRGVKRLEDGGDVEEGELGQQFPKALPMLLFNQPADEQQAVGERTGVRRLLNADAADVAEPAGVAGFAADGDQAPLQVGILAFVRDAHAAVVGVRVVIAFPLPAEEVKQRFRFGVGGTQVVFQGKLQRGVVFVAENNIRGE